MELEVKKGDITQQETDCLIVNLFEGVTNPAGATGAVDRALDGTIVHLIAGGDFKGEAGTSTLLYTHNQLPSPRVLIVGLGKRDAFDMNAARLAAATALRAVKNLKGVRTFSSIVHGAGVGEMDTAVAAQALTEGTLLASYVAPQYKRQKAASGPDTFSIVEFDEDRLDAIRSGLARGEAIAAGTFRARDYVSEPGNILYPVAFADRVETMADEIGLNCTVLSEADLVDLKMNILLAVSKGSANEARVIILEHAPSGAEENAPLVLVGKGVTFDTGGISLKPGQDMWLMKNDMGGAAAVIGAMEAIARLNVQKRIIGVAACVENMPDGAALRPGDILTGVTGKTCEIISTDAEGRLILADTLAYVARYHPAAVVDVATLTGAIGIALGPLAAGLFSNNEALSAALVTSAERSGERLWPMPLFDEYIDGIKSDMAEVKNSANRMSGVAASAKFLEHFTEGYPWAHLDIANMAWTQTNQNPVVPKGAVGYGVRLLVDLAETWNE